jgi:hypothetical protein
MTPHVERLWRILLWGGAALLGVGALSLVILALLYPRMPRPLPAISVAALPAAPKLSPQEVDTFARKSMSRAIVKPAPPPPPKPVLPPLDMVIRLSGIIDYGPDNPREAFIEIRQTSQTKSYRVGDQVPSIGAVVKGIADGVVIEYDGKLWKLTDRGVTPAAIDPVTTSGTKP